MEPQTMLNASDHAGVSEVLSSEISELAGLLRFDHKMPLVSDTQHAKVKFAHWETFGAAPMPVAVKEIKVRLIDDSREETDRAVRVSNSLSWVFHHVLLNGSCTEAHASRGEGLAKFGTPLCFAFIRVQNSWTKSMPGLPVVP